MEAFPEHRGFWRLDRVLAVVLAVLLFTVGVFQVWRGGADMFLVVAFVGALAPALWLWMSYRGVDVAWREDESLGSLGFFVLAVLFLVVLSTLMVLTWGVRGSRGPLTFALWALLPALAVLLVFTSPPRRVRWFVLLIAAPAILLEPVLAQSLSFPGVFARDPWIHMEYTSRLMAGAPSFLSIYNGMPVFHALLAAGMTVSGLDYAAASLAFVTLPGAFLLPAAVFYLGATYFGDKVALLASIVAVTGNEVLRMFIVQKPNSLGLLFLLVILVVAAKSSMRGARAGATVFLGVILIGTHSLATLQLALLLLLVGGLLVVARHIGQGSRVWTVPLWVSVLILGGAAAWWTWVSGHMELLLRIVSFDSLFGIGTDTFFGTPGVVTEYRHGLPFLDRFLFTGGLIVFCGLAILGSLYMLASHETDRVIWVAASALPLVIGFGALSLGGTLVGQRWWSLSQMLLAIQAGLALALLASLVAVKRARPFALAVLMFALAFLMMAGWTPNLDNQDFSPDMGYRNALTGGEIQAVETLDEVTFQMRGDQVIARLGYGGATVTDASEPFVEGNYAEYCGALFLVREEVRDSTMRAYSGIWKAPVDPIPALSLDCSLVYANGQATAWIDPDRRFLESQPGMWRR